VVFNDFGQKMRASAFSFFLYFLAQANYLEFFDLLELSFWSELSLGEQSQKTTRLRFAGKHKTAGS
jgi:hypothetical protein